MTNTKTLSGGERSYTTLALLLALGAVTELPFAIFDEVRDGNRTPSRGWYAAGSAGPQREPACGRV